jgi:hypothetical protein
MIIVYSKMTKNGKEKCDAHAQLSQNGPQVHSIFFLLYTGTLVGNRNIHESNITTTRH